MRLLTLAVLTTVLLHAQATGPARGSLLVIGGGNLGAEILNRFIALAGGPDTPVVYIPTAGDAQDYPQSHASAAFLRKAGCKNVTVLHTRDRAVADSETFVAPLRNAGGIFFGGGRQWRLVDAYLGTLAQREFEAVLARGGVIAGSSAGATIQGSYLVRGAREGNHIMMAPGYERGFGYLKNAAIDQHLLKRNREKDLVAVVNRHPQLLGIGIDENTAVVVEGNRAEVIGASKVAIYRHGRGYFFLSPGDRFDLTAPRQP
jgi:cyanophycinase